MLKGLNSIGDQIQVVFGIGVYKPGGVNGIVYRCASAAATVDHITGVRVVAAVAWNISGKMIFVFFQRVTLDECFSQSTCPCFGVIIKAKILHQLFRVQFLEIHLQCCDSNTIAGNKRGYGGSRDDTGDVHFLYGGNSHGIQILFVGHRVDGNEPTQIFIVERTGNFDVINLGAGIFMLIDKSCDNGIHLGLFEILDTHIRSSNGEGFFCHIHNGRGSGIVIAEKDVGQCSEYQHGNDDHNH